RAVALRLDPELRPAARSGGKLPLFVHAPGLPTTRCVNGPRGADRSVAVLPREGDIARARGEDGAGKQQLDRAITKVDCLARFRVGPAHDPGLRGYTSGAEQRGDRSDPHSRPLYRQNRGGRRELPLPVVSDEFGLCEEVGDL